MTSQRVSCQQRDNRMRQRIDTLFAYGWSLLMREVSKDRCYCSCCSKGLLKKGTTVDIVIPYSK